MTPAQFASHRRALGWTQQQTATALGISAKQVANIENGRSNAGGPTGILFALYQHGDWPGRPTGHGPADRPASAPTEAERQRSVTLWEVICDHPTKRRPYGLTFHDADTAATFARTMYDAGYQVDLSPDFGTESSVASALDHAADFYGDERLSSMGRTQ